MSEQLNVCSACKESFPSTTKYFSINNSSKNGFDKRCKKCVRDYMKGRRKQINETMSQRTFIQQARKYLDRLTPNLDTTDWQGGKLNGTIFKCKGAKKYTVKYTYTSHNALDEGRITTKNKTVETYEEGQQFLLRCQQTFKEPVTNRYRIITHNNLKYVIVQLSQNYVSLFSISSLDLIRKINLAVTKSGAENSKYYCLATLSVCTAGIHNVISDFDMCDHWDRYPLDNRDENIYNTNHSENNKNRSFVSYKKIGINGTSYVAQIKWMKNVGCGFEPIISSMEFPKTIDGKAHAFRWLNGFDIKVERIDDEKQIGLRQSYEEIMTRYSDGFKWCDNDDTRNPNVVDDAPDNARPVIIFIDDDDIPPTDQAEEDILSSKNSSKDSPSFSKVLTKAEKYTLFKEKIDPEFTFEKYSINPKNRAVIQPVYNDITYKFCGHCNAWVDIKTFGQKGVAKTCKPCKNGMDKSASASWKLANKQHISEYNKKYREKD